MSRPMGIMASFSKVSFRKDGEEVFSARVNSGGCFGPDKAVDVINRGYTALNNAIASGTLDKAALDFNTVSVGGEFSRGEREYAVTAKGPTSITAKNIKPL